MGTFGPVGAGGGPLVDPYGVVVESVWLPVVVLVLEQAGAVALTGALELTVWPLDVVEPSEKPNDV